jgi:hypothetical protein
MRCVGCRRNVSPDNPATFNVGTYPGGCVACSGRKEEMVTYTCPFGGDVIRADNADHLNAKIHNHNLYAHGTFPIVVCGNAPLPWAHQTPNERIPAAAPARPFALSRRAV